MKIYHREELDPSEYGPIISYGVELDPRITLRPKHARSIVSAVMNSGHVTSVNIICISSGYGYDGYDLDFDTFDELFEYIDRSNLDDAEHFILQTSFGRTMLGLGFELGTNRMNMSFRRYEEADMQQLIETIEDILPGCLTAPERTGPKHPKCRFCNRELPKMARKCPWCGKEK